MRLALFGYGAMGQLVAAEARHAGDTIGTIISSANSNEDNLSEKLEGHDVAIDFSVGEAVVSNLKACAAAGIPLVEGTTGWKSRQAEVIEFATENDATLVYGANFSIGVNIFYRIVSKSAELFAAVEGYSPFIEEAHHSRKKDAPSGTALRLKELMSDSLHTDIAVASTRAGHIPGTHKVGYDSEADQILLVHEARSRKGFAAGALLAARWIVGRKGIYEFGDVIDQILKGTSGGTDNDDAN